MTDDYGLVYKPTVNSEPIQQSLKFLDDSWVLKIHSSPSTQFQEEYGTTGNIGFAKVTAYNAQGEEIEIPKCPKCDVHMSQMIGREWFAWACTMGCDNG